MKTRLTPPLTPAQALALHIACLQTTAVMVASLPRRIRKFIYFTGSSAGARLLARRLRLPATLSVRTQGRGDLGARLRRMFGELFRKGYKRVVIIGSDSPTLPRARLLDALAALGRVDVTLGPTEDGGYYLLGCRTLVRRMFDRIPWGTSRTFARTIARLKRARLRYRILSRWYDVDRPSDLIRLQRDMARRRERRLTLLNTYFSSQGALPNGASHRRAPGHPGRRRRPGRA